MTRLRYLRCTNPPSCSVKSNIAFRRRKRRKRYIPRTKKIQVPLHITITILIKIWEPTVGWEPKSSVNSKKIFLGLRHRTLRRSEDITFVLFVIKNFQVRHLPIRLPLSANQCPNGGIKSTDEHSTPRLKAWNVTSSVDCLVHTRWVHPARFIRTLLCFLRNRRGCRMGLRVAYDLNRY